MSARPADFDAVRSLAVDYCEAIHNAKPDVFDEMCHDNFSMTAVTGAGKPIFWDKAAFVKRLDSRDPFDGEPSYEILGIDIAGGDMARVHLWVDVPPRRFEDHLGFVRLDGAWRLMTKVFRTASGPDLET